MTTTDNSVSNPQPGYLHDADEINKQTFCVVKLFVIALLLFSVAFHDVPGQHNYSEFTTAVNKLYTAKSRDDLETQWMALVSANRIPFVVFDSVAFLYRGQAKSVTWMGDFNGWGSNKTFQNAGTRIPGSDIWILKTSVPIDARLDYKILINDRESILDPINPFNQWSGVGGGSLNSELRMPEWKEDPLTVRAIAAAPKGEVLRDLVYSSRTLGYQITYSIYTPPGYQANTVYPILYVTDGYEYMHERMGNMITVLDNLIYLAKMQPVVAVFLDHREPTNRTLNRRMIELGMNEKYMAFLTTELLPALEGQLNPNDEEMQRAIIGTSLGGLSAACLSFSRPDLFSRAGIQSPAFWFKPEIYSICERADSPPEKIFLSTGLIHDAEESVRKIRGVLDRKQLPYELRTVNQGQSWGNWRDLLDDMLVFLFPVAE
jgi:enterochelin esterase family protein